MKRWALMSGDIVANVVEQDTQPQIDGTWIDVSGQIVGPGCIYKNGVFTFPVPIPIITKVAMITRFTDAEFTGILSASKTDVEVEGWYARFSASATINLDDSRTQTGMQMLVTKNLLTQARATAILTDPVQQDERP